MNLTIFGATGSLGKHVVQQALERGRQVLAVGRRSAKLTHGQASLHFARGDVTRYSDVEAAVKRAEVVRCALGAGESRSNLNFF